MARIHWRIVAVSSDGRRSTMDEHTAAARAEQAAAYPPRDDTAELLARADALAAERADAARRDLAARNEGREQARSEEQTSELQSLMRISYAVFFLNTKK